MPPATPAFSLLLCPPSPKGKDIPPTPFPAGRGRPRLFHARGFAPCIPGTEPMVRRKNGRKRFPARVPPGLRSRGAGGGSPRRNKVKVSPFPAGEERSASAGRGDRGQEIKLKAWAADNPTRRAPRRATSTPTEANKKKASPLESRNGGGQPVPRPVQPRGCKGRSPLHEKTKNLPLPRRGRALCERGLGGYPSPSGKEGRK